MFGKRFVRRFVVRCVDGDGGGGGGSSTPPPQVVPLQLPDDHPVVTALAAVRVELKEAKAQAKTAQDALAAAQADADKAKGLALRYEVAAAKGLDSKFASRLAGSTREEIEADADEFLTVIPAFSTGVAPVNFGVGNRAPSGRGAEDKTLDSIIAAAFK